MPINVTRQPSPIYRVDLVPPAPFSDRTLSVQEWNAPDDPTVGEIAFSKWEGIGFACVSPDEAIAFCNAVIELARQVKERRSGELESAEDLF